MSKKTTKPRIMKKAEPGKLTPPPAMVTPTSQLSKAIRIGPHLMEDLTRARDIVVAKAAGTGPNAWLNSPMRTILSRPGWEPVLIQLVLDDWSNTLG